MHVHCIIQWSNAIEFLKCTVFLTESEWSKKNKKQFSISSKKLVILQIEKEKQRQKRKNVLKLKQKLKMKFFLLSFCIFGICSMCVSVYSERVFLCIKNWIWHMCVNCLINISYDKSVKIQIQNKK